MTITDTLTFIGIVVSIIFGFFITHFYSIRDERIRVLKDYYISQVISIKARVDKFFHSIAFGRSSFGKVINWYNHLNIDAEGIDLGIRKILDLQIEDLNDIIDSYYGEITKWDDFNDQSKSSKYLPITEHRYRLLQMKKNSDDFLNNYINHINQANVYPIWTTIYRRIKQNHKFYKKKGYRWAFCRSIWERIEKHIWESLVLIGLILSTIYLIGNLEVEKSEDYVTPLKNISNKQDSIFREIQLFRNKYTPTEVKSKTFNNSSFFSVEKVDSVHIKVYQKDQANE